MTLKVTLQITTHVSKKRELRVLRIESPASSAEGDQLLAYSNT